MPRGLPTAIQYSPIWTVSESPSSAAVNPVFSIFNTERSVWGSFPIILAGYAVLSLYKYTLISIGLPRLIPSELSPVITCELVKM